MNLNQNKTMSSSASSVKVDAGLRLYMNRVLYIDVNGCRINRYYYIYRCNDTIITSAIGNGTYEMGFICSRTWSWLDGT